MFKKIAVFFALIFCLASVATSAEITTSQGHKLGIEPVQVNFAYNVDGEVEYVGWAVPNVADSAEKWMIQKYNYNIDGLISIRFADDEMAFSKSWDNRETYSYE